MRPSLARARERERERERQREWGEELRERPRGLAEGELVDERLFQATTLLALRPELSSSASSRLGPRSRVSVAAKPATIESLTHSLSQWRHNRLQLDRAQSRQSTLTASEKISKNDRRDSILSIFFFFFFFSDG